MKPIYLLISAAVIGLAILPFTLLMKHPELLRIWIIGDSTACAYTSEREPRAGWGESFGKFFLSNVSVFNRALSGKSTKSFIDQGLLDQLSNEVKPGDYLLIQFGHNDAKILDPLRYTDPGTDYKSNLIHIVTAMKKIGVLPVLLTPIERRKFINGVAVETHGGYPLAVLDAGAETGTQVIDITAITRAYYQMLGEEESKRLFMHIMPGKESNYPDGSVDDSHLHQRGADEIAKLIADSLKDAGIPVGKYLARS